MNRTDRNTVGGGDVSGSRTAALRAGLGAGLLLSLFAFATSTPAEGASLRGSRTSVNRQVHVAREHDFSYLRSPSEVKKFASVGLLVRLPGNADYAVEGVSFPYARPEMKLFIERLSRQYRSATGEKLVVTSLTRPLSHQPRNASQNSVHPTGMAADIRRSHSRAARRWLEGTLLTLEQRNLIEATLERRPWHYHVAVFPRPYADYVNGKVDKTAEPVLASVEEPLPEFPTPDIAANRDLSYVTYQVQSGDTLWTIAQRHQTSVSRLKKINAIRSPRIYPGQTLMVPAR